MANINEVLASKRTAADDKPTGRQLFEMNKQAYEDMVFDDDEEKEDDTKPTEEAKEGEVQFDSDGEDYEMDPTLYANVGEDDEDDVDFD